MSIVRRSSLRSHLVAFCYLFGFFSGCVDAHAQQTTPIIGTVVDSSDALIPKAHVTLESHGRPIRGLDTDAGGSFSLRGVPSGEYDLRVAADGFRETLEHVVVSGQPRITVKIKLSVLATADDVTVSAESPVQLSTEIEQNQSSTEVDRDALDRLPVFDADYITTLSRFLNSDATGTNGVTLIVNGVQANGPGVSASGIQSVKINQNPYTALYAAPGRARIEITTKPGTPQFHGSLNVLYRNSIFDARNYFATVKPSEKRVYFEGALTGPLPIAPKTTFLLTANHDENRQQAVVFAATPSGDVKENVPNPTIHDFYSGRIFHDYGNANQVWAGYSYEQRDVKNFGAGGTVLPEAASNTHLFEHEINAGQTLVLSPRMVNQLHFLVGKNENRVASVNQAMQIVVSSAFTGGGAQADFYRTENHFDGTDIVTYSRGKHEIKFGIDIPDISRRGYVDKTNSIGTYTFSSLAAYANNAPTLLVAQRGQPRVVFWETVLGGIVEDTIRLRRSLSIAAGLRYYYQNYFHDVPTNFAPRFSFAYAPSARGGTVFRGGAGLFYDRSGPAAISDLLHFDGTTLRRYVLSNPAFPYGESSLSSAPVSEVKLDSRRRIPSVLQYSVAIEQQLTKNSTFSATYVGTRGMNVFRSIDANAPPAPAYDARPDAALGQLRLIQPEGYAKSNLLELSMRARSSHLTGQAQYTLGKSYNNTQGITWFPNYSYAADRDWSRSDNDRRHKFDLLGTVNPGYAFTLGTALSLYSGMPVTVLTGSDSNHDGVAVDRPAGIARNTMHGPSYIDLDMNLNRDFYLHRDQNGKGPVMTFSVSSFNVLNHVNPTTYVGVVTSPFFGKAISSQPPRRMQFNLQFKF